MSPRPRIRTGSTRRRGYTKAEYDQYDLALEYWLPRAGIRWPRGNGIKTPPDFTKTPAKFAYEIN
jgi:hypothetical protein